MDPLRAPRGVGGREAHMKLLKGRREGDQGQFKGEFAFELGGGDKKTETKKIKSEQVKAAKKKNLSHFPSAPPPSFSSSSPSSSPS